MDPLIKDGTELEVSYNSTTGRYEYRLNRITDGKVIPIGNWKQGWLDQQFTIDKAIIELRLRRGTYTIKTH